MSPQEIFARAESTYTEALASLDPETRAAVRFGMWRDAEDDATAALYPRAADRGRDEDASLVAYKARRDSTFIPATSTWTHAWPGGFADVRVLPLPAGGYRVCVGSCDDHDMAIDVATLDEARRVVLSLPCIIDVTDLLSRGFFYNC